MLSPNEIVNILYTVTEHPQGWAGPGAVPIPREKERTVAYLAKTEGRRLRAGRRTNELYQLLRLASLVAILVDSVGRRANESRKLLLAGILVNLVLALTKIAGGLLGHSNALIADGIESSLDVLSSAIMWGAIKYAERPPDTEHPYGHGKMESLAAVAGSLLLVAAGAALGFHSIRQILLLQGSTDAGAGPAGFTLVVLVGNHSPEGGPFSLGVAACEGHRKPGSSD